MYVTTYCKTRPYLIVGLKHYRDLYQKQGGVVGKLGITFKENILYSWKILRAPIFKDFKVSCSISKILSLNFVKNQELI